MHPRLFGSGRSGGLARGFLDLDQVAASVATTVGSWIPAVHVRCVPRVSGVEMLSVPW